MKMTWPVRTRGWGGSCACLVAVWLGSGCSLERIAVNKLGNALAGSGSTFASDNDPELIRQAVPFSLKLMESLLVESPRHEGLLLAAASGFTQYAYAFVQQDADRVEAEDFEAAARLRVRARKLYLRARDYGVRGLEVRHPGFSEVVRRRPAVAVQSAAAPDVPLLYWTAAAWGAAIAVSKDQPALIADQDVVAALIERALALDPDWNQGALHAFMIDFEMARADRGGDPTARARRHFERALELTAGQDAAPLVSYAEAVCVPQQNKAKFELRLRQALAIDPDARPETRLVTLILQQRARWLLARVEDLILEVKADPE